MARSAVRNLSFWRLQAWGWGCFYIWNCLGAIPTYLEEPKAIIAHTITDSFIFAGSCIAHPVCRRLVKREPTVVRYETTVAALSIVIAGTTSFIRALLFSDFHTPGWATFLPIHMESTFILFMWCTLYFSVKQWQRSTSERERLLQSESEAREARLQAMRYQLNPHFLFNSLNAVSTLVLDHRTEAATQMLSQIGDLLRATLDPMVQTEIPLSQELTFTEVYLAIEQTRLGDRLKVEMSIADNTRNASVPSLLLQPLVENAVRYGVSPVRAGGTIAIASALDDNLLRITISNSGPPADGSRCSNGAGIGIRNTAARLQTLYGEKQRFAIELPACGGCTVTVELPFRDCGTAQGEVACAR